MAKIIGIDVSEHNGSINWAAVKKAGVSFAFVRTGYGVSHVDNYFKRNMEGALSQGIPVGIYHFSYALNAAGAKAEAEYVLKLIQPYKDKITLPVFYDFEYDTVSYAKKQGVTLDREAFNAHTVAFCETIKAAGYENVLFVTVFTGLRQGEVLGLTWDCVDFERGTLLINKQHNKAKGEKEYHFSSLKNDRIRMLTVADDVMDVLRRQKALQTQWAELLGEAFHNDDNLVFTNEYGRFIANQAVYRNYKKIMEKIGLGSMRFHDLRHTYAVNSLKAGDDIKTVQENLGHATAAFTLGTYAHATIGMKRESAKRMEQYIQSLRSTGS